MTGIRFHEPNNNRDIVRYLLEDHRNGAVGLEKVDGAAVVMSKRGGFGLERGVGFGEGEEVLTD